MWDVWYVACLNFYVVILKTYISHLYLYLYSCSSDHTEFPCSFSFLDLNQSKFYLSLKADLCHFLYRSSLNFLDVTFLFKNCLLFLSIFWSLPCDSYPLIISFAEPGMQAAMKRINCWIKLNINMCSLSILCI